MFLNLLATTPLYGDVCEFQMKGKKSRFVPDSHYNRR
jgi:hypothetical protein